MTFIDLFEFSMTYRRFFKSNYYSTTYRMHGSLIVIKYLYKC